MRSAVRFIIEAAAPAACVFWIAVEGYSALFGQSGLTVLKTLKQEAAVSQASLDELVALQSSLDARARQLNPKSLDPDLVDERIRSVLGYADDGEYIIPRREFDALIEESRERL